MNVNNEDEVIDLAQIFNALWKRLWIIVVSAAVGAVLILSGTMLLITPKYHASAMMYVNNTSLDVGSTKINLSDLSAAQSLVETYIVILNSRGTLEQVIERSGVSYSYETLKSMLQVAPVNDTEVFEVTVTSTDPHEAEKIANTIVEILPKRIKEIMDGSNVQVVDYAVVPKTNFSPNLSKNTMLGALLGAAICIAIIVIRELMDTKIHSEDYLLQQYSDVPLLAVVPSIDENGSKKSRGNYYYSKTRR
ncbi:MAG: hypothetical protein J5994_09385 [Ruminococcus sp.]|nr:hypothetical protein [Ruminococcus sp.]